MASLVRSILPKPASLSNDNFAKLASNPLFNELQTTLATECYKKYVPYNLCTDTTTTTPDPTQIAINEAVLLSEFRQISRGGNPKVRELQTFYTTESATIETQRRDAIAALKSSALTDEKTFKTELECVHKFYDQQRSHLTSRISASLKLLKGKLPTANPAPPASQKNKTRHLSPKAIQVMSDWFDRHLHNPYPTEEEKQQIADECSLSMSQVKAWFANKRNRTANTRPKKQKRLMENKLLMICNDLTYQPTHNTTELYTDVISKLTYMVNAPGTICLG